jgi:3-isopropylmalate/(R)-2-methylmalate dehydratase small subunit
MTPFTELSSRAIWFDEDNVDTDAILPARFLLLYEKQLFGRHLFHDRRYTADGAPRADFILNQPAYANTSILIGGRNFGCGSSREHAVWALVGHGIRCVIAASLGEIFEANCLKNGVLPIALNDHDTHAALLAAAKAHATLLVDLRDHSIRASERRWSFDIDDNDRAALLNGWDEIEQIAQTYGDALTDFETAHRRAQPWLFGMSPLGGPSSE